MTRRPDISYQPRLLPAPEAAAYLGVSQSTLRSLAIPRRVIGARRLFDRLDLDAYASELPYDGAADEEASAWDRRIGG